MASHPRAHEPDVSWEALIAAVRSEHPHLFRAWFEDLEAGTVDGGELRVVVADPAKAWYLQDECTDAFVQSAMQLTGRLLTVRFICAADLRSQPRPRGPQMPLNADYTFEQFVVGPSNRLAHAACQAVCNQPGVLYNPLFLHGPSGVGKTHLLQATCGAFLRRNPTALVVYVTCETFVNDFVRAIETGELVEFRNAVRQADMLVIDDVQFLGNRESTQEELFHTFNVLYQARRQLILSADSAPTEIPILEDRLVSRFNWGLVTRLDLPNRETRHAILQKKARLRGCEVPDDVLDFVAEKISSNIRLLEGALTKLISETQIGGKPMTLETAQEVLQQDDGAARKPLQIAEILDAVSGYFSVRPTDLVGRKRTRSVSHPRQIAMYLARRLTPLSLEEVGAYFGGRDHSTVLHAEKVVETTRGSDAVTADALAVLTRQLVGAS